MKIWLLWLFLIPFAAFADTTNNPLPADQVFQVSIASSNAQQVVLHWKIAKGYHLYRERFSFNLITPKTGTIGNVILPAGISKEDMILGKYQVYENQLDLTVPLNNVTTAATLAVGYQGCADSGFCYPPTTKTFTLNTGNDRFANLLQQKNYLWIALAFLGFGLLLSFTPCVLPMIPILSGIIIGQRRAALSTRNAFFLSLAYVIGMSVTYAIAGVLVALAGSHLSAALQTPWVIVIFSIVFVLLALSLFGFYELQLPGFLQQSINDLSNRQKRGSHIGAFVMGALSVLIVSPCVTAPLVGVLTFIAQSGDVILGALALLMMGIGMGIPLLIIGTSAGKLLPKAGRWMNTVKTIFGILLLAVAIYLLERVLSHLVSTLLWAALFIITALCLIYNNKKLFRSMGILLLVYGVFLLQPLITSHNASATLTSQATKTNLPFQRVKNIDDVKQALAIAQEKHQLVMLDFYADWCVACKIMERTTFNDPAVKTALNNVLLLQADVTANDATDKALEDYFHVVAPPTMLFFKDNKEFVDKRLIGETSPKDFLKHVEEINHE